MLKMLVVVVRVIVRLGAGEPNGGSDYNAGGRQLHVVGSINVLLGDSGYWLYSVVGGWMGVAIESMALISVGYETIAVANELVLIGKDSLTQDCDVLLMIYETKE